MSQPLGADYYFCNATTKRKLPCQNRVTAEGLRCWIHSDPPDKKKSAREFAQSLYHALKEVSAVHDMALKIPELVTAISTLTFAVVKTLEFIGLSSAQQEVNRSLAPLVSTLESEILSQIAEMNETELQRVSYILTLAEMEARDLVPKVAAAGSAQAQISDQNTKPARM